MTLKSTDLRSGTSELPLDPRAVWFAQSDSKLTQSPLCSAPLPFLTFSLLAMYRSAPICPRQRRACKRSGKPGVDDEAALRDEKRREGKRREEKGREEKRREGKRREEEGRGGAGARRGEKAKIDCKIPFLTRVRGRVVLIISSLLEPRLRCRCRRRRRCRCGLVALLSLSIPLPLPRRSGAATLLPPALTFQTYRPYRTWACAFFWSKAEKRDVLFVRIVVGRGEERRAAEAEAAEG